jgi:hypothetical protein
MGVEHADGTRELLNMGQVLINTWDVDETGEAVEVEAVDLAQLIADAKHYTIETPAPGTTYAREFERLAAGILPVRIADGLSLTATVNAATIWARERDKNLTKLCKAWGARWYVDDDGYLTAAPAYPDITDQTPPVVHLTGGTNGTVVARARSGTRERLYNAVVVTGRAVREDQATTEPPVPWAAAEVRDPRSPIRIDGPYGRRPKFYTSEMLTTSAECQATAIQMLAAASGVSRTEPVACVPDPSMDLGDVVRVVTRGIPWTGRVQSFALPLTAAGGSMKVVVSNAPAANEDTPES